MPLKFGTSGVRGLATELTDQECYVFTVAFLEYLVNKGLSRRGDALGVAGDFRPSTDRIMKAVWAAALFEGFKPVNCGIIPTPAVSLYGFTRKIPSIMVTGSHIPDDRNGIKFNLPEGEVLKSDEAGILELYVTKKDNGVAAGKFNPDESIIAPVELGPVDDMAHQEYIKRYLDFFPAGSLAGKKIVFYEHTTVQRDIMPQILGGLGAEVVRVGRSDTFIPVDTEAVRPEDVEMAKGLADEHRPFAIVSADGDGDRPMLFDELGEFVRGDILGIVCASALDADSVSATASCNTAVEKLGQFKKVNRTMIGSPYVVRALQHDSHKGYERITGYEANGGFLTGSVIVRDGKELAPLPTRDAVLPLLCALESAALTGLGVSGIIKKLPQRFVYSTSIKGLATEKSQEILIKLKGDDANDQAKAMFDLPDEVGRIDFTDGARLFLKNGEIVHIRPSGNAPELRCYCEADTVMRAKELTEKTLGVIKSRFID